LNRLATLQRRLLHSALAVLLVSGAYWALIHYLGARSRLSEPLLMKIHGAAAMAALVLVGGLVPGHVSAGWALRQNRSSGTGLLLVCGLLTITGHLLYYSGDEAARALSSYAHLALGIALPIVLGAHLFANPSRQPAAISASQLPSDLQELAQHEMDHGIPRPTALRGDGTDRRTEARNAAEGSRLAEE
jgi:hypothetical protein